MIEVELEIKERNEYYTSFKITYQSKRNVGEIGKFAGKGVGSNCYPVVTKEYVWLQGENRRCDNDLLQFTNDSNGYKLFLALINLTKVRIHLK